MNLYFIRHAQPDYQNDSITDEGKEQAQKLADWLKDVHVDELYHSSMGRAGITASYLAKAWNITPTPIDWARELTWGTIVGDATSSMSPWAVKDRYLEKNNSYPTGDEWKNIDEMKNNKIVADIDVHCKSLDAFLLEHGYERCCQLYKAVEPNDKTVVIVCHGGIITSFVSYLTNTSFFKYMVHMGVDVTAVTKMNFRGNKDEYQPAQLIYVNSQSHLGVK